VVTVSPAGVEKLAREIHAGGAIVDALSVLQDGWLVDGVLGVPHFDPAGGADAFGVVRDVLCSVRPAGDASAPGFCAAGVVTVLCTASVRVRPHATHATWRLTYTAPQRSAVRIRTPLPPEQLAVVETALQTWVARQRSDTWSLPLSGPLGGAVHAVAAMTPSGHAQVGLSFSGTRAATLPDPGSPWEWTVALSRPYVVERVGEAVRAQLGGLPPPMGIDHRIHIPGATGVYLRSLEVLLRHGEVVIAGSAVRHVPVEVTANFAVHCRLDLDAAGAITVTVVSTDVELVEWYARLADFLAGGVVTRGAADGVRAALAGSTSAAAAGLLDEDLLTRIVAAGTAGTAQVRAVPRQVWVEPGSIQLGGVFERASRAPEPRPVRIGDRVDATLSRSPGADLSEVTWIIDGVEQRGMYEHRAIATTMPVGARVVLRIVTDEGRSATAVP
jgi:hypothetical protein